MEEEKNHNEDGMSDYESGDEHGTEFDNDMYVEEEECEINVEHYAIWIQEWLEGVHWIGCHLKTPYGGVLLSAIALDGNNGLFPLVVAVVENEGKESWKFFLQKLQTFVELGQDRHLCFMSDQQKGLEQAMRIVFPHVTHKPCCRHLYNNFKKKYPGLFLQSYFWKAARAYNDYTFNEVKSDRVINNFSESFNNWVEKLRSKHILGLLNGIRSKLMSRLLIRAEKACAWVGLVTPNIRKKLNKLITEFRSCDVTPIGQDEYEVINEEGKHIVKLRSRSCACRGWQISGLPCKYATAAITHKRTDIEQFCDPCFYNETYIRTHSSMIRPVPDQKMLTFVHCNLVEPPILRKKPGRPKKARTRDADEPTAATSDARKSKSL
ncbi:uncharacterized protein LOC132276012 [Cornus florida]|uniref:uncharacterized protein LOC132276012 n=1 Tax=Cornus florida TaxID=4283 RepID=UPI00289D3CAA|nr:uncharacterized protein LOC132276012 [Cornus florida]